MLKASTTLASKVPNPKKKIIIIKQLRAVVRIYTVGLSTVCLLKKKKTRTKNFSLAFSTLHVEGFDGNFTPLRTSHQSCRSTLPQKKQESRGDGLQVGEFFFWGEKEKGFGFKYFSMFCFLFFFFLFFLVCRLDVFYFVFFMLFSPCLYRKQFYHQERKTTFGKRRFYSKKKVSFFNGFLCIRPLLSA